jgi:hypothetical protein
MTQAVDTGTDRSEEQRGSTVRSRVPRLRWWREVLYILAFYGVYTFVRNTQGSGSGGDHVAKRHALEIIRAERWLHIFDEQRIQHWFIHTTRTGAVVGWAGFIEFWNLFYGTFHFIVTIAALVLLFRRFPQRYPRWRNTLACTTALALIGFAFYPLMPPRLLDEFGLRFGFIDTLDKIGSLWSFDSGTMQKLSNQYAAMPSLHFAWSTWSAFVLWPSLRRWWSKALAALYPLATLFAIVVTGNHYILDAAGGVAVFAVGYVAGSLITRFTWPDGVPPRVLSSGTRET